MGAYFQTYLTSGISQDQVLPQINQLQLNIGQVLKQIPRHPQDTILLLGDTGEGKTSLINYMAGKTMEGSLMKGSLGQYIVQTNNPLEGTKVSHGSVSETKMPVYWEDWCDLPGLGDTSGAIQDIVNAFTTFAISNKAKRLKVLLVVSENTLNVSRGSKFMALIKTLSLTFQSTDDLVKGLGLIVTKAEKSNSKLIKDYLRQTLREQADQLNFGPAQKQIIEFLASPQSQITFFHCPKNEGILDTTDRRLIYRAVNEINYMNSPKPSISFSHESQYLIEKWLRVLQNDKALFIQNKFLPAITTYIKEQIQNHRGNLKELRSSLSTFNRLLGVISDRPDAFMKNQDIVHLISSMISHDLNQEISAIFEKYEFINLVTSNQHMFQKDNDDWTQLIAQSTVIDIESLIGPPEINYDEQKKRLTIIGTLVGMIDVKNACVNRNVSQLDVFCFNSLYVDEDLNLPGLNLTFISPQWVVVNSPRISLQGCVGENHNPLKANTGYFHGRDGLPGLPGFNGGSFYGKANNVINLSSLTINVNGGKGGQGQEGGNGCKGQNGGQGGYRDVQERIESSLVDRLKIDAESNQDYIEQGLKMFFTFNTKFKDTYVSYQPGQIGGNAGIGGIGGHGGNPGSFLIDSRQTEETNIINQQGTQGFNGQPGKPGLGGMNGPTYRGVYINELILPELRGMASSEGLQRKALSTGIIAGKTVLEASKQIVVKQAAQKTTVEATKQVVKQTAQKTAIQATKQVAKQAAQKTAIQATKQVVKQTAQKTAIQATKQAIQVGKAATLGKTIFSLLKGAGVSILVQGAISAVSAHASSGWEIEPYKINDGEGQAEQGHIFKQLNTVDAPRNFLSQAICVDEQISLYKQFHTNRQDYMFCENLIE